MIGLKTASWLAFAASLVLQGCAVPPAEGSAEACAFEGRTEIPLHIVQRHPVIVVMADGKPLNLVFDTGAEATTLFEPAVERSKLRPDWGRITQTMGISGNDVHFNVTADDVEVAGVPLGRKSFSVAKMTMSHLDDTVDGVLGLDVIRGFDVDLDLQRQKLTLYRWRNCPQGRPNWEFAYRSLPLNSSFETHYRLSTPGAIGAEPISILVDTGAVMETVALRAALRAGIDNATIGADPASKMYGFGRSPATAYLHNFPTFSIGPETFRNAKMAIVDFPPASADALLGYNWMLRHRLWFSFASRQLYVAEPSAP